MNAGMYNTITKSGHLKIKDGSEQIIFPTEDSNLKAASFVDGMDSLKPYETLSINEDTDKKTNEDRDKETNEWGEFENWIMNNTNAKDLAAAPSDTMTTVGSSRKNANDHLHKHLKQVELR